MESAAPTHESCADPPPAAQLLHMVTVGHEETCRVGLQEFEPGTRASRTRDEQKPATPLVPPHS